MVQGEVKVNDPISCLICLKNKKLHTIKHGDKIQPHMRKKESSERAEKFARSTIDGGVWFSREQVTIRFALRSSDSSWMDGGRNTLSLFPPVT